MRRVGMLALLLSLLVFQGPPSMAAEQGAAAATPAKSGPQVVETAEIPLRADADERFAQDVVQRSRGQDPTAKLRPRLESLGTAVQQESQRFKRDELKLLSISRLESLERHWKFYGRQLDAWRRDLQQSMDRYTEDAAELARRRSNWEATRADNATTGLASALDGRIQSVLGQIALAEQAVSGPIDKQVRLMRHANAVETAIVEGQRAVATAIAYNDSRLSRIDSPPIWELWNDPRVSESALKSVALGIEVEKRFLDEYNAANADFLRALNVVSLLLLPLLLWLSFRTRRVVSDDPEIQAANRVLRRPISSWIVLAMVGIVLLEPDAPVLRHQAAFLLAVIPVLRLLPPYVYAVLGPWPYVATGLYLLQRLSLLLVANPYYYRLYLLGLTLLTAALLGWILWRRRPRAGAAEPTFGRKLVRFAGWAGIGGLVALGGRQRRRQRLAGRDAHRGDPRERLCRPGAVCRRDRAVVRAAAVARAPGVRALQRRDPACRAAAAKLHAPAATGRAGGLGRRRVERVPHLPPDQCRRDQRAHVPAALRPDLDQPRRRAAVPVLGVARVLGREDGARGAAGRGAAEDVAAARRRQQHLLADLLRGGDRSAWSSRSPPPVSR